MSGIMTVAEFIAHAATVEDDIRIAEEIAIVRACLMVQRKAKALIGHEQPFWPPLKPETIARKSKGNTPLLETGEMRSSIEFTAPVRETFDEVAGYVGSNNDKAVWHELGTKNIPPRSFLAAAASDQEKAIVKMAGELVFRTIVNGGRNFHGTWKAVEILKHAAHEFSDAFHPDNQGEGQRHHSSFWSDLETVAGIAWDVIDFAIDVAKVIK